MASTHPSDEVRSHFYAHLGESIAGLPRGADFVMTNAHVLVYAISAITKRRTLLTSRGLDEVRTTVRRRGRVYDDVTVALGNDTLSLAVHRMFRDDVHVFVERSTG